MNPARILAVLTVLLALGVAACGGSQPAQKKETFQSVNAQVAETEGIYLHVDGLKYQVQISRQLNPLIVMDRDYMHGVAGGAADLGQDEEWFAIFMRIENPNDKRDLPNATEFQITDTQGNVYRPVQIGRGNVWAYRAANVRHDDIYPIRNSPAGERPPYGSLLLFRLRRDSLDNRPLELKLTGRSGQQAIINLDV